MKTDCVWKRFYHFLKLSTDEGNAVNQVHSGFMDLRNHRPVHATICRISSSSLRARVFSLTLAADPRTGWPATNRAVNLPRRSAKNRGDSPFHLFGHFSNDSSNRNSPLLHVVIHAFAVSFHAYADLDFS
jgi:hypothetical protein